MKALKAYSTVQRGFSHKHFCEDACLSLPFDEQLFIGAISDGCSSGKDSHFASALSCKLIRQVVMSQPPDLQATPGQLALLLLQRWIKALKKVQHELLLPREELLASLILMVYSDIHQSAVVLVLGDGVVDINGQINIVDQQNVPDYPVYHLNDTPEVLEQYLLRQRFEAYQPAQLAIASDGILSFVNQKTMQASEDDTLLNFLLSDRQFSQYDNMLTRKCNILSRVHNLEPYDDLSILRLIL